MGRLVKGSGRLEIIVRERRRRCREKHRFSVRPTKKFSSTKSVKRDAPAVVCVARSQTLVSNYHSGWRVRVVAGR